MAMFNSYVSLPEGTLFSDKPIVEAFDQLKNLSPLHNGTIFVPSRPDAPLAAWPDMVKLDIPPHHIYY